MMRRDSKKILKFGLVGVGNTFLDYALFNTIVFVLSVFNPLGLVLCNVLSFLGANVNSYFLNKKWTFEDRGHWSKKEYLFFLFCSLGGLGINCSVIFFLSREFLNPNWSFFVNLNIAKLVATVAGMIWNFFSYRAFVFKHQSHDFILLKDSSNDSSASLIRS